MRREAHLLELAKKGKDWKGWYTIAAENIRKVCREQGWEFDRFVDVLAITSPRVSVKRNIRVAIHYMKTKKLLSGTIRSTRKAMQHYEQTGEIRGPKTLAFAKALKGDLDQVVLDVWMAYAFEIDQARFSVKSVREEAASRIVKASQVLGWKPAETQAAIWAATVRASGKYIPALIVSDELTLFD